VNPGGLGDGKSGLLTFRLQRGKGSEEGGRERVMISVYNASLGFVRL